MRLHRFLSFTDLVVALVVALAIFLPKRPIEAVTAYKIDDDERAELARAEALALAHPEDGGAAARAVRELIHGRQLDWAEEVAQAATRRASPETRWEALSALVSVHARRGREEEAQAAAAAALAACRERGSTCREWDMARIRARSLDPTVIDISIK
jgi:hypothetical protein